MFEVGEILVTAGRALVALQILEADDPDRYVIHGRLHGSTHTLLELDTRDAREQLDADRGHAEPNHLIGTRKQIRRQRGNVHRAGAMRPINRFRSGELLRSPRR